MSVYPVIAMNQRILFRAEKSSYIYQNKVNSKKTVSLTDDKIRRRRIRRN